MSNHLKQQRKNIGDIAKKTGKTERETAAYLGTLAGLTKAAKRENRQILKDEVKKIRDEGNYFHKSPSKRAEFFTLPTLPSFRRREKPRTSALGNVVKGALALGAGAAAMRYGPKAIKSGLQAGRAASQKFKSMGLNSGYKRTIGYSAVKGAYQSAKNQLSQDAKIFGIGKRP
jgi:hypothetical protein